MYARSSKKDPSVIQLILILLAIAGLLVFRISSFKDAYNSATDKYKPTKMDAKYEYVDNEDITSNPVTRFHFFLTGSTYELVTVGLTGEDCKVTSNSTKCAESNSLAIYFSSYTSGRCHQLPSIEAMSYMQTALRAWCFLLTATVGLEMYTVGDGCSRLCIQHDQVVLLPYKN